MYVHVLVWYKHYIRYKHCICPLYTKLFNHTNYISTVLLLPIRLQYICGLTQTRILMINSHSPIKRHNSGFWFGTTSTISLMWRKSILLWKYIILYYVLGRSSSRSSMIEWSEWGCDRQSDSDWTFWVVGFVFGAFFSLMRPRSSSNRLKSVIFR